MKESPEISKARAIIDAVKGKSLSIEERYTSAVELAALILVEAKLRQTKKEKHLQSELARMMNDPVGKVFTTALTDQCFRSQDPSRVADQMNFLMDQFGIPSFLSFGKRLQLRFFRLFGALFPRIFVPLAKYMLRKQTASVILPGEPELLAEHMRQRQRQGVRINLNHLGEAILGEDEAQRRLQVYLDDLAKPEVEYISVKISTICSQLNLIAWDNTLELLAKGLRELYRCASKYRFKRADGVIVPKFVNLDMEEYRDLHLTVELFRKVLEEPEFFHHSAGIVLQSYLPDSYHIQQQLTLWAMNRVHHGGAPIKIRIVKGANLAMEQVDASLKGWYQAPYTKKADVDANFKRMLMYGFDPEHAHAAHLGIASHNLFDIAYGLIARSEKGIQNEVCFEMLEGMANHIQRVIQDLSGDMLLYCPAATKEEFQNAVAYLVRRLDENTAQDNFLRHAFELSPGTTEWREQAELFKVACFSTEKVSAVPRRTQNRLNEPCPLNQERSFENEPDTDWSLLQNRIWGAGILNEWKNKEEISIPLVIGGEFLPPSNGNSGRGEDPSEPGRTIYRYRLADSSEIEKAIKTAKDAEKEWSGTSPKQRSEIFAAIAQGLRKNRSKLIGACVADTGKTVPEADSEISEAIDFAEYYRRAAEEWFGIDDIKFKPKGTALIAPPWNFPCSIPFGGIAAALLMGNCVIFKPAPESILVGWELVQILWEVGISKEVLQFVPCRDEAGGSQLVKDPRISFVVLTGATSTAKHLLKLRPGLDLIAETGGKNAIIVSQTADRDLAVKDIIQSAFGYAGQKCSACSLAILEAEVYNDPNFRRQLRDAAASLKVGSAWDSSTKLNPLIRRPGEVLKRGLTELESGEEWLLKPKQHAENPNLWSPGIKFGVTVNSHSYQNELFGPVLSVMRAENLKHAIDLANGTPYGLTSGLHSLDEREQDLWMGTIESGNCYINRGITGAIVRRQPFGGCKDSSFGPGFKAGGPNYLTQMVIVEQAGLPQEADICNPSVHQLDQFVSESTFSAEDQALWSASIASYAFYWNQYFSQDHDSSLLIGQDNILRYVPQKNILLRIQDVDRSIDILRECAAALTCGASLTLSGSEENFRECGFYIWSKKLPLIQGVVETEEEFIQRLEKSEQLRLRLLSMPSAAIEKAAASAACRVLRGATLANGRLELLNYLREVSFSIDYHRYGNLGIREGERRATIVGNEPMPEKKKKCSPSCGCF